MNDSYYRNSAASATRSRFSIALPVVILLAVAACGGGGEDGGGGAGGSTEPFVVGAAVDQSGGSRSVGVPQLNGIKAAIEGVNRRGGVDGHPITLVVRDTGADAARAVSVYRELADQHKVSTIAGFIASTTSPAVRPAADRDKMAILATGAPGDLLKPAVPSIFSTIAFINDQGKAGLDYIQAQAKAGAIPSNPRVALLYYSSPAGASWHKDVVAHAKEKGLQIVAEQNSPVGAASLGSQMTAIAAARPDAILAFDIESDVINAAKAGKAAGLSTDTLIVNYSFASSPSALKGMAEQGFPNYVAAANYGVPGGAQDSPAIKTFAEDAAAVGLDPHAVMAGEGYAQGLIIADTLKRCGFPCPPEKFRTNLEKMDSDLGGLAFAPVKYTDQDHTGVSAVRFRQWDSAANTFRYVGEPIAIN